MAATLTVDLNARIAQFETEMKRATGTLDKFGKKGDETAALLRNSFKTLGGFLGAREIISFAKASIDASEALSELSDRSGLSVKSLVGFQFAAEQTGASIEDYAKSLKFLNRNISEIASGDAPALKKLLEDLGLKDVASGSVKAEEALLRLAEVFPRLNDADRVRVAMNLLGKSGEALVPALAGGRGELEKLISTGQKLNPITQEQAKQADNFNDAVGRMGISIRSVLLPAFDVLLPGLESTAQRIATLTAEGHGFLAFMRGLAGVGKIPFDILLPDTTAIKDASDEVARLQKTILETRRKIDTGKSPVPFLGEEVKFSEKALATLRKNLGEQEFLLKNAQGRLQRVSDAAKPPSDAAKPPPLKLTNSEQLACEAKGGTWDGKKCIANKPGSKADPASDFVKKLRDEASTLGLGSEALLRYEAAKLKLTGTNAKLAAGFIAQITAFKDQQAAAKASNEEFDAAEKIQTDLIAGQEGAIKSLREYVIEQQFEASLIGKTNSEREVAIQLRAAETVGLDTQTEAYRKFREQITANADVKQLRALTQSADFEKIKVDQADAILLTRAFTDGLVDANGQLIKLSETEYLDATAQRFGLIGEKIKETNDIGKELGLTFSSAFEDAVAGGKDFSEVLKGLAKDIQKIVLRKTVTEPLGNALSGALSGIDFGKLFGFSKGGIAAFGSPVPLSQFSHGGISNTAAIFGEAGPEAAVPLPDGRSIPVKFKNGGGSGAPVVYQTINIDARGADSGVDAKIRQAAEEGARRGYAMVINDLSRGGSVARMVGTAG